MSKHIFDDGDLAGCGCLLFSVVGFLFCSTVLLGLMFRLFIWVGGVGG